MTREEKEELEMLMLIEEALLPGQPHILTYGSKPGHYKAKTTWAGKENPDFVPPQYPKEEFTKEDLKRWGVTHYMIWGS